jgi:hypothetical protein
MFRAPSKPVLVSGGKKGGKRAVADGSSTGSKLNKRDSTHLATLLRELTVERSNIREAMG